MKDPHPDKGRALARLEEKQGRSDQQGLRLAQLGLAVEPRDAMEIGETLYVIERRAWREWLEANFDSASEIWLVYPNKASGEPRILYNDAVEEALCFGWIDSIIKKPDELRAAQRFSPRRRGSRYSQLNKERLRWLAGEGLLHPSVRASVEEVLREEFVFPDDILDAIRANDRRGRTTRASPRRTAASGWRTSTSAGRARRCSRAACGASSRATERGRQLGYGGARSTSERGGAGRRRTTGALAGRRGARFSVCREGYARAASRCFARSLLGRKPTIWPTGSPPLKTSSVGIERIPY